MRGFPGIGIRTGDQFISIPTKRTVSKGFSHPPIAEGTVTLNPGDVTSFWIEWSNVDGPITGELLVTPPDQRQQLTVPNRYLETNVGRVLVSPIATGVISNGVN